MAGPPLECFSLTVMHGPHLAVPSHPMIGSGNAGSQRPMPAAAGRCPTQRVSAGAAAGCGWPARQQRGLRGAPPRRHWQAQAQAQARSQAGIQAEQPLLTEEGVGHGVRGVALVGLPRQRHDAAAALNLLQPGQIRNSRERGGGKTGLQVQGSRRGAAGRRQRLRPPESSPPAAARARRSWPGSGRCGRRPCPARRPPAEGAHTHTQRRREAAVLKPRRSARLQLLSPTSPPPMWQPPCRPPAPPTCALVR